MHGALLTWYPVGTPSLSQNVTRTPGISRA